MRVSIGILTVGKTSTVVESILQIFTNNPNAKILVSTFSNTACDQVGRRLFSYLQNITNEPVLLRIYSICYGDKIDYDVEDNYMEATNMCHVYHMFPSINTIKTYRIVLATHYIIGKYVHSGLKDNFTHIFIDENASTTIPDAMCAIAGIWTPKVKVILSGTLEPCAPLEKTERFIGWKYLPNKDIPLIFHECSGKSLRDEDGPSLYNTDEIEIVMKYINILLKKGVEETDIGIVSPYRKQYSIIKSRLEKARLNYIEVGSPEIFQGKEKPVIIASTVRSNTETIGFLNNQR
uniref:DNA2/NAM7 helicase-like C-terminal domain-containing protein n=1 Tax=Megaselia scalaris TaxID=36166 RepID=T1GJ05_MEGSC